MVINNIDFVSWINKLISETGLTQCFYWMWKHYSPIFQYLVEKVFDFLFQSRNMITDEDISNKLKLMQMITFLFKMQYFEFNNEIYIQNEGFFITLSNSGQNSRHSYDLYSYEEVAMNNLNEGQIQIPLYVRYVDDLMLGADDSIKHGIKDLFHMVHEDERFEMEEESNQSHWPY